MRLKSEGVEAFWLLSCFPFCQFDSCWLAAASLQGRLQMPPGLPVFAYWCGSTRSAYRQAARTQRSAGAAGERML